MADVADAHVHGDLADGVGGIAQQELCAGQAGMDQVFVGGQADAPLEQLLQIEFIDGYGAGQVIQGDALRIMRVDIAAGVDDIGGQAVCAVAAAGGMDAVAHQLGEHGGGLHIVVEGIAAIPVELHQGIQCGAYGHIRAGLGQVFALVLGEEQLVVGVAGRAVKVDPQQAALVVPRRGAVILRLGAVNPENLPRAHDVMLAIVIQLGFAADAQLDQVGGQVFPAGIIIRPAEEIAQLLYIGNGGAGCRGRGDREPGGFLLQVQVVADFYLRHG